jgi:hypothetical protein
MSETIDGKTFLNVKEVAAELGTNEHYVRQLGSKWEIESAAVKGGWEGEPGGIENTLVQVGGVPRRMFPTEAVAAYKAKQGTPGAGGGRVAMDGKKAWKFRLTPVQLEHLNAGTLTADEQHDIAATIKSGSNYDPVRSRNYRMNRKQREADGDDGDEE